ncbi:ABC transporter substrate-binding protein [Nocardia sp. SYP-A9097]|uniref:ABC transporter substrate-binding protein n=1 Tax=Nocardia sp. SYP-A9097 TaxID=2663237 RepID=UPI001891D399|nr:ABC transporter substrate-binding protein [Nocardia sp. SYP-A9097]
MRKSRIFAVATAVVLAVTPLAGCGGSTPGGVPDDTLTMATASPIGSFDPVKFDIGPGKPYWQAVYDTLLRQDADRNIIPGLAAAYSYDAAHTTLTLNLRKDIRFSDGAAFDANAAKANLSRFTSTPGPNSAMGESITGIDAARPDQLILHLSAPDPALLPNLGSALGAMVSPDALSKGGFDRAPVGSGPYLYDPADSQPGTVIFRRNSAYPDGSLYPFDRLELVALSDPNTIRNGLTTGRLDTGSFVSTDAAKLKAAGLSTIQMASGWNGLVLADRAGTVQPALGKPEVRQAINMVVDRDLFRTLAPGNPPATTQIFAPGSGAYEETLNSAYPHDIAKAKELMTRAGYPGGFAVTMPDMTSFTGSPALNTALDMQLGTIGITVTWEKVPPQQLLTSMTSGRFPMFFMQLGMKSSWEDLQLSVLPAATWNPFHATDPELTALISTAQHAEPGSAQDAAFQAVNRRLVQSAWFAPIFGAETVWASVAGVRIEQQERGYPDLVRFQRAGS